MFFNPFEPLIQNIQELLFTNIQKEKQRKDKNAYSLEFVRCKPNHLDKKSCIWVENESSTMPLQECFQ